MPEGDSPPAPVTPPVTPPTPTNAPAFVQHDPAQEIARLNRLLEKANTDKATLQTRMQELEGQVDQAKQQELEQRLSVLEQENTTLKGENQTLKDTQTRAATLAELTGKVRDPEAALALLTDDLRTKEGTPNVDAILVKYPYLAPEGTTTATAPNGGGGTQPAATTTLDTAVASKDPAAINAAFDAELKGASK